MKVDAARCAAVGPSGPGGFERRSTHYVSDLVSMAQRSSLAEELVFFFQARELPAPVRSAGGECLRRVPDFSSAFPHRTPRVGGG